MRINRFNRFVFVIAIFLILLSFSACGKADSSSYTSGLLNESLDTQSSNTLIDVEHSSDETERKIIETIELSVETKTFDALLEQINSQIKNLGGYIQSSNISGRSIDSDNYRYANIVIRIPAEQSDDFSEFMSENSVITNRIINTEDVTLTYVDTESRITALEVEKAALEQLLANATSVDDIIDIRKQLTEVIYSIESYKSQLRTYDSLIEYSTVTVYINEVEKITEEKEQGMWQKIGLNLKKNFIYMWRGVKAVFVFFVSAIPFFIPLIVVAAVVFFIIKLKKKSDKKKTERK